MTTYEIRRQERAAWLMYQLGLNRQQADAITRAIPDSNRRTLVRDIGAFRIHGLSDDDAVSWCEAGVCLPSLAYEWNRGGYTAQEFAALRDVCVERGLDNPSELLTRILEDGVPYEFALLSLRAGATTGPELTDWHQQDRNGEDIRSRLVMMAGLSD